MTTLEQYARQYKLPAGAAKTNETIRFTLGNMPGVKSVSMLLRKDDEENISRIPFKETKNGFGCELTLERQGLYFYCFETNCGYIGFDDLGSAILCDMPVWAQQTVYLQSYRAAESYFGAIGYQVFPDRFARGGELKRLAGRVYHENLADIPCWQPNEEGEIKNNDFYGGDIQGIIKKLPYIKSLGATILYLNPICEAASNHRYDTADYMHLDPQLGTEEDFKQLCAEAKKLGMRVVLDGVFSHTGDDSRYFNRCGRYDTVGAYQSVDSEYFSWYRFKFWPEDYYSWWGVKTLPELNEEDPSYCRFICGRGGVIDYWMGLGVSGFRLDVADELPDEFIKKIRTAVLRNNKNGLLIGEVWEDASNKISYDTRRQYFWGEELDGTLNYPFRTAVLDFISGGDAQLFKARVEEIYLHYPEQMLCCCWNMLSSHDTPRAISALAAPQLIKAPRSEQAGKKLCESDYLRGVEMVKLAYSLIYTLPGIPMLYYGDEIGMQGYGDPFCRGFFEAEGRDENLYGYMVSLGKLRQEYSMALSSADIRFFSASDSVVGFYRGSGAHRVAVLLNRGDETRSCLLDNGSEISAAPWQFVVQPAAEPVNF